MYCKNCGNFLKSNARFCSKCGTAVNRTPDLSIPAQQEFQIENPLPTPIVNEESPRKNIALIIITAILILATVIIVIPTVILPFINGKNEEPPAKTVITTEEQTTTSKTTENDSKLVATKDDFETLSRLLLVTRLGENFNYKTTSLRELIEEMILSPVSTEVYDTYFDNSSYESYLPTSSNDTDYLWDPLKKFNSGYGKFSVENVKWICENIYHISFTENYSPVNSYCQDGYIYVGWQDRQDGESAFNPSIRLTNYAEINNDKYAVTFEQFDEKDSKIYGKYTVIVDLRMIAGKRCWTFYSVNMDVENN